jgi:methylthioribose-1-phosphate isomerase
MGAIAALLPLITQLASSGLTLFTQIHAASQPASDTNTTAANVAKIVQLIPTAVGVFNALQQAGDVLQKAQAEKWTDDDPRWQPVFDAADKALADAEARLT